METFEQKLVSHITGLRICIIALCVLDILATLLQIANLYWTTTHYGTMLSLVLGFIMLLFAFANIGLIIYAAMGMKGIHDLDAEKLNRMVGRLMVWFILVITSSTVSLILSIFSTVRLFSLPS